MDLLARFAFNLTPTLYSCMIMFWQQVKTNIKRKSDTSLEPTKTAILKRRVGYGEINEINEEEEVRSGKRNKMDVDNVVGVSSSST